MPAPKDHIEFIRLVSGGMEYATAYATIRNLKAINANCKSQGSRLAKKYAKEIAKAKEKAAKMVDQAHGEEIVKNALKAVLTQAEVDAKLCDIIRGEAEYEDIYVSSYNGSVYNNVVIRKPNHQEVLKAIDIYHKRFGSYAAEKIEGGFDIRVTRRIIQKP